MADHIRVMFSEIADRYDRANTFLSFGLHRRWRRAAVALVRPRPGADALDVCTGTGDMAIEFRRALGPSGRVVGIDFSAPMLERARAKAERAQLAVEFQEGDALRLGFPDATFDVAGTAFGIRNVDDPIRCLREMARVVRPGGRVLVLEFGQPRGNLSGPFRWYSRHVVPRIGGWLTGHRSAYEYLPRTSALFPTGALFLDLMRATGRLADLVWRPMSGGIVHAYAATVRPP